MADASCETRALARCRTRPVEKIGLTHDKAAGQKIGLTHIKLPVKRLDLRTTKAAGQSCVWTYISLLERPKQAALILPLEGQTIKRVQKKSVGLGHH